MGRCRCNCWDSIVFDADKSGVGVIWILIALITARFWYLEAKWKVFQYATADRARIIESLFRDEQELLIKETKPLQIYSWWCKSYSKDNPIHPYERESRPKPLRISESAFKDFVMLPYRITL